MDGVHWQSRPFRVAGRFFGEQLIMPTDDTITLRAQATCRTCGVHSPTLTGTGETFEEAELALHEALEAEGFTNGLCETCAVLRFLN